MNIFLMKIIFESFIFLTFVLERRIIFYFFNSKSKNILILIKPQYKAQGEPNRGSNPPLPNTAKTETA
jgi:predicted rRNA methylase YqxC with S4 and FtsJ domains